MRQIALQALSGSELTLNFSSDGVKFQLSSVLAKYITKVKDELFKTGSMKFDYINSAQMRKVIEYLEYRHKYSPNSIEQANFHIEESQAMELLIIADRLGI